MPNKEDYRNLTGDEIYNLPLDLRVCYFILPWNTSAKIDSVDKWIDKFWVFFLPEDECEGTEKEARENMKEEHTKLLEFIAELVEKYK